MANPHFPLACGCFSCLTQKESGCYTQPLLYTNGMTFYELDGSERPCTKSVQQAASLLMLSPDSQALSQTRPQVVSLLCAFFLQGIT